MLTGLKLTTSEVPSRPESPLWQFFNYSAAWFNLNQITQPYCPFTVSYCSQSSTLSFLPTSSKNPSKFKHLHRITNFINITDKNSQKSNLKEIFLIHIVKLCVSSAQSVSNANSQNKKKIWRKFFVGSKDTLHNVVDTINKRRTAEADVERRWLRVKDTTSRNK